MAQVIRELSFSDFANMYCERQEQTPDGLREVLQAQLERFGNKGWFMLECAMLDSSRLGELTILPYGPNNTFKALPNGPVSPRGLASDMSVMVAFMLAESLPTEGL